MYTYEKQETREFSIGGLTVTIGLRADRSMWISVTSARGGHFQCDYIGDFEKGPKTISDFAFDPPKWVSREFAL